MRVGTGRILDYQTGDGTAIGLSLVYLLLVISRINLLGVNGSRPSLVVRSFGTRVHPDKDKRPKTWESLFPQKFQVHLGYKMPQNQ
jgi:hypothetical protein